MKVKIANLGDLSDFLQSLKVSQLAKPVKVLNLSHEPKAIVEVEITDEPFYSNAEDGGYTSELKRSYGENLDLSKFKELEPVGTIILHAE